MGCILATQTVMSTILPAVLFAVCLHNSVLFVDEIYVVDDDEQEGGSARHLSVFELSCQSKGNIAPSCRNNRAAKSHQGITLMSFQWH